MCLMPRGRTIMSLMLILPRHRCQSDSRPSHDTKQSIHPEGRAVKHAIFVFAVWRLVSFASVYATEPSWPNIVVIYADDLWYGDVRCYNPDRGKIPTPNIDRLASQGMH